MAFQVHTADYSAFQVRTAESVANFVVNENDPTKIQEFHDVINADAVFSVAFTRNGDDITSYACAVGTFNPPMIERIFDVVPRVCDTEIPQLHFTVKGIPPIHEIEKAQAGNEDELH